MMRIEISLRTRWSTQSNQKRCYITPAHEGDTKGFNAVVHVHAVFKGRHRETIRGAGVFAYLPPGVHADFVLKGGVSDG